MKKDKPKIHISHPATRKYVRKAGMFCTTSFENDKQIQKWEIPALGEKPFSGKESGLWG